MSYSSVSASPLRLPSLSLSHLAILFLALQALAAPEHGHGRSPSRRSRAHAHAAGQVRQVKSKRSSCARQVTGPGAAPASDGVITPSFYNLAAGQEGDGQAEEGQGHWKVITTSVYIDAQGSTSIPAASSAVNTASSSVALPSPTLVTNPNLIPAIIPIVSSDGGQQLNATLGGVLPTPTIIAPSSAAPQPESPAPTPASPPTAPGSTSGKHIFAHFMVGIVSTYKQADWEADLRLAKSKEITGFALNIGVDPYNEEQLDLAYAAADVVGFDLFISFDFNWYKTSDVTGVVSVFKRYATHPRQLKVDGKPFVSTFIGDGFDWSAVEREMGMEIYSVPFYQPSKQVVDTPSVSGLFSWAAWPGQLDNQPILQNMTTDRDLMYMGFTEATNKEFMAPVSPWFFTHFGQEVQYAKNWLFYSETLWYDRWEQILKLGDRLNFLEIVTWNDYGESHYIGPFDTPHTDDGSSKWAEGLDHTAHLDFAVPYIKAFKAGLSAPVIEQDMLIYWYRPHLKSAVCDSTDNCLGKPTGWDMVQDVIFVATLTRSGGTFTVNSGFNSPVTQTAGPGVQIFQVPMGVGNQVFNFEADGKKGSDSSNVTISAECWNGIYNYNYHAGKVAL